ncbi:MAG: hypothetical protein QGG84_11345, partial [Rhodospirillales bacterium]|nr:hypothetical protein [Rhodospirillales bacterium]
PLADGVHKGLYRNAELARDSLKLILWFAIRNSREGDEVNILLKAPDGKTIGEESNTLKKPQSRDVRVFAVTSKGAWPPGVYKGEIAMSRRENNQTVTIKSSRKVTIK